MGKYIEVETETGKICGYLAKSGVRDGLHELVPHPW
jgi:hypothetical protein